MKKNVRLYLFGGRLDVLCLCLLVTILFSFAVSMGVLDAHAQSSSVPASQIKEGDEWYFFKGTQIPPSGWNSYDHDVSYWQRGLSGIGYGMGSNRTYIGDMQGKYLKVYARKEIFIDDPSAVAGMTLSVVCDGPFAAYLNGVEMLRTKTIQGQPIGTAEAEQYNVSGFVHELAPGKNIIALECENDDIDSKDFSFIPVFEVVEKGRGQ